MLDIYHYNCILFTLLNTFCYIIFKKKNVYLLFSHQSDSEGGTSSSTENTTYDISKQQIHNENCLNEEIDQSMYIQMEFCEKSTLRYTNNKLQL